MPQTTHPVSPEPSGPRAAVVGEIRPSTEHRGRDMAAYLKMALLLPINFAVMYVLTYALIDSTSHFHLNINRAYMALLMVAPMTLIMMLFMRSMFPHRRLNLAIATVLLLAFGGAFALLREQGFVGDRQFLRSMIPHHSSAIVMCERSRLADPEIIDLCGQIVRAQQREIAQMTAILGRL